jgi:hypothetical protein
MKYKVLYITVFALFISHFSLQATATELCGSPLALNLEKPPMDKEPEGEEEEEEEPDCDD